MHKTIGCGLLALALLGVVQTAEASKMNTCANVHCKPVDPNAPLVEEPQLAAPVLPASPKAVTRFSAGASHLRQQVHIQTQGRHAP